MSHPRSEPSDAAGTRAFAGFGPEAVGFFRGLEQNNTREYFTAHRALYEAAVKAPFQWLLRELASSLGASSKLFRQERDSRFSRDKSPYKVKTYGVVGARPGSATAHYVELSAAGLFAASGYYDMAPDQLASYRSAVADDSVVGALNPFSLARRIADRVQSVAEDGEESSHHRE